MITFIPKEGETIAGAGIRAGGKALLIMLFGIPIFLWSKRTDILDLYRNLLRKN